MSARVDRHVVLDLLSEARSIIATGAWTQHGPAADQYGRPMADVRRASAWSPIGALMLACSRRDIGWHDATASAALRALQVALLGDERPRDQTVACCDIADANDELDPAKGHATVVSWFTAAIATVTQSLPRPRAVGGAR